ncbi:MAG: 30S ribosomal protein S2 [Patescibacteria group bacterium]|nr:30S ribosomal protein S2 [Patescibacteria group bacterium]
MQVTPKNIDLTTLPDKAPEIDLRELLEAGCHFGHQKANWNPAMDKFIYTEKDGIHIFDLAKTAEQLVKAYNFFYKLGKNNKTVVMLGTKRQAREVVEKVAKEAGMFYIVSRWLGGFLTNWKQVKKSLHKMESMEAKMEGGDYDAYTKYEQAQFSKEISRFGRFFNGLRGLKAKPDAVFIVDPMRENVAAAEARTMKVSVIAVIDSNGNPQDVDLAIPANDDAVKSIELIVELMGEAYLAGKEGK